MGRWRPAARQGDGGAERVPIPLHHSLTRAVPLPKTSLGRIVTGERLIHTTPRRPVGCIEPQAKCTVIAETMVHLGKASMHTTCYKNISKLGQSTRMINNPKLPRYNTLKEYLSRIVGIVFSVCLILVIILHYYVIKENPNGLHITAVYSLPLAIELARPEAEGKATFCRDVVNDRRCRPVSSASLMRYLSNGRYKMRNPPQWAYPGGSLRPFVFVRNKVCQFSSDSLSVSCLAAYEGRGPNGEEFFLCAEDTGRCFMSQLVGVEYPHG